MAVEKLTIIEGPMSGLGQNPGALESTGAWMRSHGISPGLVALGALGGAALTRGSMMGGAVKWAFLFGLGSWIWYRCGNRIERSFEN